MIHLHTKLLYGPPGIGKAFLECYAQDMTELPKGVEAMQKEYAKCTGVTEKSSKKLNIFVRQKVDGIWSKRVPLAKFMFFGV